MKISRHEARFVLAFAMLLGFVGVTGVLGMLNNEAMQNMLPPVVPPTLLMVVQDLGMFLAAPFIMLAAVLPAGKDDLLKWN